MTNFIELAIISLTFGFVLGYLIGIFNHSEVLKKS